eukprot:5749419-Amphidinium_carterae.2
MQVDMTMHASQWVHPSLQTSQLLSRTMPKHAVKVKLQQSLLQVTPPTHARAGPVYFVYVFQHLF